ncbi:MAG: alpha-ribazole phosphatase family protein [Prevotella sp.]|nr:alpha-ribazole phosphatase family protein [Prevotella sp.]MCI1291223.1 alpha-ribazole phosphatase family protein [Prevotella sp.]MCI1371098.1 alpha-ribazole phosphatase family protein [Prevotella sp.]MCI1816198.1 alpha-ribazole phosphatase family protein [Prevotella sp.]MCI2088395.1 alpha-ribazole phosphatase family protein [Prevotella sp.]MCI2126029.1 alpha-ribazole phosphatase family protein [Prevotella sp.]
MKVILIRHTRVGVPKGTCYGWADVPVAETFPQEAAETESQLGKLMKEEGIPSSFDAVFTSPLTRARKLAAFCGYSTDGFPARPGRKLGKATIDNRLKEMNMGAWEMKRFEDIAKTDPFILKWYDDYMHLSCTGGEGFPDLYARVSSFLDELKKKPYRHAALFAHGGVLICAGIYGGLFSAEHAFEHETNYGGIEEINI